MQNIWSAIIPPECRGQWSPPFVPTRGLGRPLNGVWRAAAPPPAHPAPRHPPPCSGQIHTICFRRHDPSPAHSSYKGRTEDQAGNTGRGLPNQFQFSSDNQDKHSVDHIKMIRHEVKILIKKKGQQVFANNSFKNKKEMI